MQASSYQQATLFLNHNEHTTDTRIGPRMMMWQICMENLHSVAFTGAIAAIDLISSGL